MVGLMEGPMAVAGDAYEDAGPKQAVEAHGMQHGVHTAQRMLGCLKGLLSKAASACVQRFLPLQL